LLLESALNVKVVSHVAATISLTGAGSGNYCFRSLDRFLVANSRAPS
jgi:hypothetical protein